MADCGGSGSTLDRAARALGGQDGGKHVASWLGHLAVGGSAAAPVMPVAAPDHIVLPTAAAASSSSAVQLSGPALAAVPSVASPADNGALRFASPSSSSMTPEQVHHRPLPSVAGPLQHPMHQHAMHPMAMPPPPSPFHPFLVAQQHQLHQHQQAMAMMASQQHMIMIQHQQLARMRHQQQLQHRHQQQQQQRQRQLQFAATSAASRAGSDLREGAAKEREVEEEEDGHRGHEGSARPARIEELAAAWAEAQAEYEELEDAVNLAAAAQSGYGYEDEDHENPESHRYYEFVNKVEAGGARSAADSAAAADEDRRQQDWMEEGMARFAAGDLREAVRAFETELQTRSPDSAAAWRMLGRCHAENDQDRDAIACLERAVDRDPHSPEARLALGVSQVNELQHAAALSNLKAWITHNPKYAGIARDAPAGDPREAGAEGGAEGAGGVEAAFEEVQRLLLEALAAAPDADALEALGVVYNVSRDYDAAVDAFRRAIALQPDSYQLYNRLGATLANCGKSEEALPVYRRALELRPRYARAWLNSAISFSNLRRYDDAARCYLQTLSLNPGATHCWSYLRIALSCSERWDLIPLAAAMDLEAFREHFDFILYDR